MLWISPAPQNFYETSKGLDFNLKEAVCKESHISRQKAPLREERWQTSNDKGYSNIPFSTSRFFNKSG